MESLGLDDPRVHMTKALFLSLQDNGPDEAPPGVQVSGAGWYFPGMPNIFVS